jgi:ligand-binding SRPBCC domain-containing protein
MRLYSLDRDQNVPLPPADVFEFFSRPENLARITPESLNFRIITPQPIIMRQGTLIDYTIRVLGFPVHWTTIIEDYQPPHRFVDVQLRGPYKYWHHTHEFSAVPGGTMISDRVRYLLPFEPFSRLAHNVIVRRQLAHIFEHRAKMIKKIFTEARPEGG